MRPLLTHKYWSCGTQEAKGKKKVSFVIEGILSSVTATTGEPGLTQSVCSKNGGRGMGRDDLMSKRSMKKNQKN